MYKLDMGENTCMMRKIKYKEKLYRDILNSVNDFVFLLDREHKHIAVFGKCLEEAAITQEDFIGKTAVEIMGEEEGRVHIAANERALKGENVIYQWSIHINGVLNFIQTSLSPIYDDAGEVVQIAGVGRNITELVDLNRKISLNKQIFEARQVIDSSLKLVEAEVRRKKITLLHQTDLEKPLYLVGDGIRLRQVMLNLLNNAVKFTNEGRIIARSRILEESGDYENSFAKSL